MISSGPLPSCDRARRVPEARPKIKSFIPKAKIVEFSYFWVAPRAQSIFAIFARTVVNRKEIGFFGDKHVVIH